MFWAVVVVVVDDDGVVVSADVVIEVEVEEEAVLFCRGATASVGLTYSLDWE